MVACKGHSLMPWLVLIDDAVAEDIPLHCSEAEVPAAARLSVLQIHQQSQSDPPHSPVLAMSTPMRGGAYAGYIIPTLVVEHFLVGARVHHTLCSGLRSGGQGPDSTS